MLVIGELINCTRKRVGAAAEARDAAVIREVAQKQAAGGAHMLDVNGGIPGREPETLKWLVEVVQEVVDLPLCLDSSDPEAFRAALPLCRRRPVISSITEEQERFGRVLPLVKEYGAGVVALAMGPDSTPSGVDDRVDNASRLVDMLTAAGVPLADIYVDPCVLPISVGSEQGPAVADAIALLIARYPGVHTTAGLSNVSFGLPMHRLLNQAYLLLLISRGLDSAIVDPTDRQLMAMVRAAAALMGQDDFCSDYIGAFREGRLDVGPAAAPAPAGPVA